MGDSQRKKPLEAGPLVVLRKTVTGVIHDRNGVAHEMGAGLLTRVSKVR